MSSYFSDSSLLSQASICVVALDPTTGKAVHTNAAFTERLGPLYKFQEYAFWDAATTGESRDTLHAAIQKVMMSLSCLSSDEENNNNKDDIGEEEDITSKNSRVVDSLCLYAVEMVTVCGDNSGLPRKRYFDWTIGTTKGGGTSDDDDNNSKNANDDKLILLFGTATASAEAIQSREVEAARKKKNEELEVRKAYSILLYSP
jgi:hypothetical protein